MRKYLSTWLLGLIYIVSVVPCWFKHDLRVQNWIIDRPTPMAVAWNIKYACDELNWVLAGLMAILYVKTPNRVNITSMRVFLLWCILDCFSYFYNYKTTGYFAMYFSLPAAWLVIYYRKGDRPKEWNTLKK